MEFSGRISILKFFPGRLRGWIPLFPFQVSMDHMVGFYGPCSMLPILRTEADQPKMTES